MGIRVNTHGRALPTVRIAVPSPTKGIGLPYYNHSINVGLIYDCMIPYYITGYIISYLAVIRTRRIPH